MNASPHLAMFVHRHDGPVSAVALSPNGTKLASAGVDGVRLWDVASGNLLGEMQSDSAGRGVADVIFSSDTTLITRTCDQGGEGLALCRGEIQLWDVATLKPLGPPLGGASLRNHGHGSEPRRTTTGDCRMARARHHLMLWDVSSRQRLAEFPVAHEHGVMSLAFDPATRILAVGGADQSRAVGGDGIILVDIWTRRQIGTTLTDHAHGVRALVFSPNGDTLASGSTDGIILWDVTDASRPQASGSRGAKVQGCLSRIRSIRSASALPSVRMGGARVGRLQRCVMPVGSRDSAVGASAYAGTLSLSQQRCLQSGWSHHRVRR